MRRFSFLLAASAASLVASSAWASLPPIGAAVAPATPGAAPSPAAHRRLDHRRHHVGTGGAERVAEANAAARVQPSHAGYVGAVQVYGWSDGALYQVYAAPGEVTDVVLESGETLAGTGPVAAGDTVRWVIGDTESGSGASKQVHILLKPTDGGLRTNLVINTDRRTYHLELHSTIDTYMASVSWRYPAGDLVAIRQSEPPPSPAEALAAPAGLNLDHLDFNYRIKGPHPPWRPIQVFDDGRQTFIEFPADIAQGDMPPLFVIGPDGKSGELVNYRVQGRHLVVDRLFRLAELRMGDKHAQSRVRIEREP